LAFKFIKTGEESVQIAKQAALQQEQFKEKMGKLFRFFLNEGEEGFITFVDGELSPQGYLIPPRWYEHNLYLNGSWNNYFVCPEKTNPAENEKCPICESGDRPALVSGFTIIDHRTHKSEKSGKEYKDTRKILIAKSQTFEMLNKIAMKRGGLACATFEVTRVSSKDAAVGSMFDFKEKKSREELMKLYTYEQTDPKTNQKKIVSNFVPADFEQEIVYKTGNELRALGLGKPESNLNPPWQQNGKQETATQTDYSSQL
jgi:hypothetical protein